MAPERKTDFCGEIHSDVGMGSVCHFEHISIMPLFMEILPNLSEAEETKLGRTCVVTLTRPSGTISHDQNMIKAGMMMMM